MNRYFVLSCVFHLLLALGVSLALGAGANAKKNTTYTIDFIGSGKVVSVAQAAPQPPAPLTPPQAPAPEPEVKKPAPKAYDSKAEISQKKPNTPKKKNTPKQEPKKQETASSAAAEEQSPNGQEGGTGRAEGSEVQTLTDFPYPWYIQQVRNGLWSEWEKRRPIGVQRRAMVSFAIARDGKIKNLKIDNSSGDDSFDFVARSAVVNAGPFPALPMLFEKDELTVTVEFKQEG